MKRIFTLCLLVFVGISLNAQTIKTLYPTMEKSLLFYSFKLHPLSQGSVVDDENKYVFRDCFYENILYTIAPNGRVSTTPGIKISRDYNLRACYQTNDHIVAIYSYYTKDVFKFYINTSTKKKLSWNPQELMSIVSDKKDRNFTLVSVSPNNNYFCIISLVADKKNNFKDLVATVFDAEGQQVWENTLSPDFSNKTFNIADVDITNEGTVYLCITAYSGEKKKISNEKVYLYEIKETDYLQFESNQNIGYIDDAQIKILKNGNVFIGGYYSKKKDETIKGSFSLMYNPKEQSISNFSSLDFPSTFNEKDIGSLKSDQIMELSNGRIVLLGEQLTTLEYINQDGSRSYKYFAKNIVYAAFSANGDVEDYKLIQKTQSSFSRVHVPDFRQMCISYYAFENNGALCLLFNDHIGNYNSTKKTIASIYPIMQKGKLILNLVKIDGDDVSSHIIFNGKTTKKALHTLLFTEDNSLLFTSHGKTIALDKIIINID